MGEPSGTATAIATQSVSCAGTVYVEAAQKVVGAIDERGGKSNSPSTASLRLVPIVFGEAC